MLSRHLTTKIKNLGTLIHMEPFTHDAYKEGYKNMRTQGGVSKSHAQIHVDEGDNKVDIISRMGYFTRNTSFVFPKVKYCSLSERHTPPNLQGILVLGRQLLSYKGMCIGPECKKM